MIKTALGIDHHQNHLLIKMDTLLEQNIAGRLLKSKHAFHSAMMDPVLQPFEEIVQNIKLHPPKIPLVSTVTGNFLTVEEALNPVYWSAHIRNTVQFAKASDTLLEHQYNFLIDVGPGNTLTSF